jgi:hypothetical protein
MKSPWKTHEFHPQITVRQVTAASLAFSARAAASLADASLDCASLAAFLAAASLPGRESLHGGESLHCSGGKTMVFEAPRMVGNQGEMMDIWEIGAIDGKIMGM